MSRPATLRTGEQRLMAALHTFGAAQPSGAAESSRMQGLVKKGLVAPMPGAASVFKLTPEGHAWIARSKGLDSRAVLSDPIEEDRRLLDRGLGLADDKAA